MIITSTTTPLPIVSFTVKQSELPAATTVIPELLPSEFIDNFSFITGETGDDDYMDNLSVMYNIVVDYLFDTILNEPTNRSEYNYQGTVVDEEGKVVSTLSEWLARGILHIKLPLPYNTLA